MFGVLVVVIAGVACGASPVATVNACGNRFWNLIPFTMPLACVVIGGYLLATAPVVARLMNVLASAAHTGRGFFG